MNRRPVRVLLVEDNRAEARLTTLVLLDGSIPKKVTIAEDGCEAIGLLECGPLPDLILLDLNLPKQSGHEVLKAVKSRWPEIRVVIMSGSSAGEDVAAAYAAGADYYLTKPGDLDEYVDLVRSVEEFWLRSARAPASRVLA